MTDLIHVLLLGILEGITEFLPISSTGHLLVATEILNFRPGLRGTFEIFIQLGAVLAVVVYYRADLWSQARRIRQDRGVQHFWLTIVVAVVPAAILGFLLRNFIKDVLFRPEVVALSLIIGGVVILLLEAQARDGARRAERRAQRQQSRKQNGSPNGSLNGSPTHPTDAAAQTLTPDAPASAESRDAMVLLTLPQAGLIGLAQAVALIPGVSRAAASIFGGMGVGLTRAQATRFSFFLAIPTLGGATLADLVFSLDELNPDDLILLFIGMVVAGIVAWASIRWLLRYIATHSFVPFGIYRIVAGVLILLFFALRGTLSAGI